MEKWLDRLIAFEVTDDEHLYEALAQIDSCKVILNYGPMTAVEFFNDADMVVFVLNEDDESDVKTDPSIRMSLVEGDSRAAEIQKWITNHTPNSKMSVFYCGPIAFADQGTLDAVEAAFTAKAATFIQPPYIWEREAAADGDDQPDATPAS